MKKKTPAPVPVVVPIRDGGPAFPLMGVFEKEANGRQKGMTLRDYFASRAPAMPGEFAQSALEASRQKASDPPDEWQGVYLYLQAKWAYRYADAMLRVREIGKEPTP